MKTIFRFYHFCTLLLLCSCASENKTENPFVVHEIYGREFKSAPIYRVKAPSEWQFIKPDISDDLSDSKKSIYEFFLRENQDEIRITIHNFPSKAIEERIPPSAQIIRWKRQFDELDPLSLATLPQSFGGFCGAFFEATGIMEGSEKTMLCWSMQIAPEHYRRLSGHEMQSCYTIKAIGPAMFIEKNRKAIINFARSYELINEI